MLDEDDRAALQRLRHAAYAPDADLSAHDLERLAELERRAVEPADGHDRAARHATETSSTRRTAEVSPPSPAAPGSRAPQRRAWPMLVAALVIGATAFVAGGVVGAMGSDVPDDAPASVPAVTGELLGYAPSAERWLDSAMSAADWDEGTLQYLGTVEGAGGLVGTVNDGAQICRVVAVDDDHDVSCSGEGQAAVGASVASRFIDGALFVMRDPEYGTYFEHTPRSYDSVVVSASLRGARELVSAAGGLPVEAVTLAGVFDGISVWTTMVDGRMCVDLVSRTTVVGDPRQRDEVCSLMNGAQTELYDPFPELERVMSFIIVRTGDTVMIDASSSAR